MHNAYTLTGNLLKTVSDWQCALQIISSSSAESPMSSHVTGDDITGGQGAELTSAQLVFLMVQSLGPALSSHILSSVGGVEPEKGEELHSLMIRLAAINAQQRSVCSEVVVHCGSGSGSTLW